MLIVYEKLVPVPCSAYCSFFSSYFVPFPARDLLSVPDPFLFKFIYFFLANAMSLVLLFSRFFLQARSPWSSSCSCCSSFFCSSFFGRVLIPVCFFQVIFVFLIFFLSLISSCASFFCSPSCNLTTCLLLVCILLLTRALILIHFLLLTLYIHLKVQALFHLQFRSSKYWNIKR